MNKHIEQYTRDILIGFWDFLLNFEGQDTGEYINNLRLIISKEIPRGDTCAMVDLLIEDQEMMRLIDKYVEDQAKIKE